MRGGSWHLWWAWPVRDDARPAIASPAGLRRTFSSFLGHRISLLGYERRLLYLAHQRYMERRWDMPKSLHLTKRQQGWLIGAVDVVLLIISTSALDATQNGVLCAFVTGVVELGLV